MVAMTSVASYGGDDINAYDNYGTFWRTIIMYIYTAVVVLTENQSSQFIHKYPYHTLLKNPFSTKIWVCRNKLQNFKTIKNAGPTFIPMR